MITITATRPSIDVPFFYETLPPADRHSMELFATANPLYRTCVFSADQLTRILTFDVAAAELTTWDDAFNLAFPNFDAAKKAYNASVNITETKVETP